MSEDRQDNIDGLVVQASIVYKRWESGYYDKFPHMAAMDIASAAIAANELARRNVELSSLLAKAIEKRRNVVRFSWKERLRANAAEQVLRGIEADYCIEGDYTGEKPPARLAIERISAAAKEFSTKLTEAESYITEVDTMLDTATKEMNNLIEDKVIRTMYEHE